MPARFSPRGPPQKSSPGDALIGFTDISLGSGQGAGGRRRVLCLGEGPWLPFFKHVIMLCPGQRTPYTHLLINTHRTLS